MAWNLHYFISINQLVPPPPSPLVSWNHRVSGNFRTWSLILKDLYQSIPDKDLAPKRALKRLWGNFEDRLDGRTSKLPQSDFYSRARRVLSQFISVTGDCNEK